MPIYEYRCKDCDEVFEAIQKFSEAPLAQCPRCSGTSIERLISRSSFVLKGSGWYKTDYASKGTGGLLCPLRRSPSCTSRCPSGRSSIWR